MFERKLIAEVKINECLWKKSFSGYRNKKHKELAWRKISKKLVSSEEFCRKRWKSLRDRFVIEIKANERYKRETGLDSKSDWSFFEQISYIQDYVVAGKRCKQRYPEPTFKKPQDAFESFVFADATTTTNICNEATIIEDDEVEEVKSEYSVDTSHDNAIDELEENARRNSRLEESSTDLVENVKCFVNDKQNMKDSVLAVIGELFEKVPEDVRFSFKMDVLMYSYQRLKDIHE